MVSAGAAGYFVSLLIAGEIHQQLSAQKILVGAMASFTAGLAGLAIAPGLAGLVCAGFLNGLANGGIDIGANALIVELNRERLASALNYLHVLFGVGALLGPLIVSAAFAGHVHYWWIFGGGAMACAAIAMGLGITPAVPVQTKPIWRQRKRNRNRLLVDALASNHLGAQRRDVHVRRLGTRHRRVAVSLPAHGGSAEPHAGVVRRLAVLARTGLRARIGGRIGHRMAIPQFTMLSAALSALAIVILIAAPTAGGLAASAIFLIGFGYGPIFATAIDCGGRRAIPCRGRANDVDRGRGGRAGRNRRAVADGSRNRTHEPSREHGSGAGSDDRDVSAGAVDPREGTGGINLNVKPAVGFTLPWAGLNPHLSEEEKK